ncbi:type II secretion system F family protein [Tundrisphaera lichenicola]|uniref:type II secretion system F family protein n=1 Tax=Tundrisphaera lichenicola TaxID=2029860 RepID=UPI003EC11045
MSPGLLSGLAALTAVTGILAVAQLVSEVFLRDRSRVNDRVDAEFLKKKSQQVKKTPLFKNLGEVASELGSDATPSARQRFELMIEQSGLETTPSRVMGTAVVMGLSLGLATFFFRWNPIDALVATLLGFVLPILRVKRARTRRMEKLRSQLADAFELMARVVRAGQTLSQALLAVADEFPQPISTEFAYCYEQQNLGLSPETTFRDMTRRTGVIELKIFVLAVLVQQQTGGNLAELLTKLATVVRERYIIRGTIRTLTAEGRMQGWMLAGLPPLMLLLLVVLNPGYASVHFQHPNNLLITFGVEGLGVLWIRKIVNFDF